METKLRDPISAISHYIGAGLSVVAIVLVAIVRVFGYTPSFKNIIAALIFSASMFLLYMASGLYHSFKLPPSKLLKWRKLDHSMIYVLIAGSYTPFLLAMENARLGIILLIVVWTLAVTGVLLKIFLFKLPRMVSTTMYLAMGWLIIFFFRDIKMILPKSALVLLITGGISYSIGGVIYALKKPSFKRITFHDIFHFFVLGGTAAQFCAVYFGILLVNPMMG